MAGPLGNDLRIGIGNVGVGLDGQIVKRNDSPDEEHDCDAQHQDAIAQSKVNQITDHLPCSATAEENSKSFATIVSPALSPSLFRNGSIGCIPSAIPPRVCTSIRSVALAPHWRKRTPNRSLRLCLRL